MVHTVACFLRDISSPELLKIFRLDLCSLVKKNFKSTHLPQYARTRVQYSQKQFLKYIVIKDSPIYSAQYEPVSCEQTSNHFATNRNNVFLLHTLRSRRNARTRRQFSNAVGAKIAVRFCRLPY